MATATNITAPRAGAGTETPPPLAPLPPSLWQNVASFLSAPAPDTLGDSHSLLLCSKGAGRGVLKNNPKYFEMWGKSLGQVSQNYIKKYSGEKKTVFITSDSFDENFNKNIRHSVYGVLYEHSQKPMDLDRLYRILEACIRLDPRPFQIANKRNGDYDPELPNLKICTLLYNSQKKEHCTVSLEFWSNREAVKNAVEGGFGRDIQCIYSPCYSPKTSLEYLRGLNVGVASYSQALFWEFLQGDQDPSLTDEERIDGVRRLAQSRGAQSVESMITQVIKRPYSHGWKEGNQVGNETGFALLKSAFPEECGAFLAREGLDLTATLDAVLKERENLLKYCPKKSGYSKLTNRSFEDNHGSKYVDQYKSCREAAQSRLSADFFTWFRFKEDEKIRGGWQNQLWAYPSHQFTLEGYNFFKARGMLEAWKTVKLSEVHQSFLSEDVKKVILADAETVIAEPEELAAALFNAEESDASR